MKITKRQLKRIIKEEYGYFDLYSGEETWDPAIHAGKDLQRALYDLASSAGVADLSSDRFYDYASMMMTDARIPHETVQQAQDWLESGEMSDLILGETRMKITKRQLRKIIREQATPGEEGIAAAKADARGIAAMESGHGIPTTDWSLCVGELVDKWVNQETSAFDRGDPSMMAGYDSEKEAKDGWRMQVDAAAIDLENELTLFLRKAAQMKMQNFTDDLINGEYS